VSKGQDTILERLVIEWPAGKKTSVWNQAEVVRELFRVIKLWVWGGNGNEVGSAEFRRDWLRAKGLPGRRHFHKDRGFPTSSKGEKDFAATKKKTLKRITNIHTTAITKID